MTRFKQMWEYQRELMVRMERIEHENGLLEFVGVAPDLDLPLAQAKLRRYGWQIVEEVSEVMEGGSHLVEEVADVLHFHIEMMIVAGIEIDGGPFDLFEIAFRTSHHPPSRTYAWAEFVNHLGCTLHELKNRPWKIKRTPTDVPRFRKMLMESLFQHFVAAVQHENIALSDLYDAYFAKNKVNHERIDDQQGIGREEVEMVCASPGSTDEYAR